MSHGPWVMVHESWYIIMLFWKPAFIDLIRIIITTVWVRSTFIYINTIAGTTIVYFLVFSRISFRQDSISAVGISPFEPRILLYVYPFLDKNDSIQRLPRFEVVGISFLSFSAQDWTIDCVIRTPRPKWIKSCSWSSLSRRRSLSDCTRHWILQWLVLFFVFWDKLALLANMVSFEGFFNDWLPFYSSNSNKRLRKALTYFWSISLSLDALRRSHTSPIHI